MTGSLAPIAERAAAPGTLPALHPALTWRPATLDDVAAINELSNAVAEHDRLPYRSTLDDTRESLTGPGIELEHDTVLGFDSDGTLVADGQVMRTPGDETSVRAFVFGTVRPERRREGIGTSLLAWQIARARQRLATSGLDLPAVIRAYVDDQEPADKQRVLERAGMRVQRYFSDLKRPLGALSIPEVALTGSLRLVPFSDDLDDAARLAHNDAFRDHWGSQPQTREQWHQHRANFAPGWSFLVVDDEPDVAALLADERTDAPTRAALEAGEPLVVGYAMASRYESDFAPRGYSFGYTDLLGARRAYRGRKAAMAALAASLRAFEADGMEAAVLDVDTENPSGAHGMYAALGYEKEHGSRAFAIEL